MLRASLRAGTRIETRGASVTVGGAAGRNPPKHATLATTIASATNNAILRVTLEIESVMKEARHVAAQGFRNILLVAGEHPKFVSNGYLERCVGALVPEIPSISLEVAPMEAREYASLVAAGAEGLVV